MKKLNLTGALLVSACAAPGLAHADWCNDLYNTAQGNYKLAELFAIAGNPQVQNQLQYAQGQAAYWYSMCFSSELSQDPVDYGTSDDGGTCE